MNFYLLSINIVIESTNYTNYFNLNKSQLLYICNSEKKTKKIPLLWE
jgi:hypothetical protein